ncbi:MAG: isoleucine--tRNA ligase [Planctomycetes bacterium]|nr:isoleucine--tRNA ligase [Planctomycetota bacterium]MCW8136361.1 isoleucine--tRNA ligase [Planctomycetota bacterium]
MTEDAKAAKERYKSTVLLPKTDFPMKAGLQEREPALQQHWDATNLYGQIRKARAGAKPWVLHDGPPYANGDAHTGTGMNKILKDMVVKFRTMQGYDSPYVPGWDCHGLPIEHKMLEELGGTLPEGTTALQLREKCLEYANKWIDTQRNQFKSAGVLGRWAQPYLTTNPLYEANVLRVFRELMARGFITRAKRSVHWSWAAKSALAEAELEYEDRTDPSVYVRFPVSSCGKDCKFREMVEARDDAAEVWKSLALLIWTTTPWTLPANVAVAAHDKAEYVLVRYTRGGKREYMVMAEALLKSVAEKAKLADVQVLETFRGEVLRGVGYSHPFLDTACPLVFADYVTLEDGTGLVHTAPGHGKEDFETGKRERLPVVCPVDESGKFFVGERLRKDLGVSTTFEDTRGWLKMLEGQNVFKANPLIVNKLREEGWLLHDEPVHHSYPHCWRTHTPVIFRATEQWFVQVDHVDPDKTLNPQAKTLRQRLLDEIAASRWFPAWGQKRISSMVENRPDWCVSRQRYWGIPIPAFADAHGQVVCDPELLDHVIALVEKHGSNVWFDDANWPVEKLLPEKLRGRKLTKLTDIFDVWFEAGSSFQAVMRADPELAGKGLAEGNRAPHAAMYLEGDDQHRGWFQVSLILSVATTGVSPFRDCLTSAFVVDEKGEKGSKSKGNIWAIDKGVKDLGADLIRLYFASMNTSEPIPVTYKLIQNHGETYRKLRNTWRGLVGNLFDFDPARHMLPRNELLPIDQWALSQCAATVEAVTAAWERYEFHVAMRALHDFANVTLSAQYMDLRKDSLYCDAATSKQRRSAQTAYWVIADTLTRLLAPVLAHTVEDMWQHLPGKDRPASAHLAHWPTLQGWLHREPALDERFELLLKLKAETDRVLDRLRKEKKVGKGYDTAVSLGANAEGLEWLGKLGTPEHLTSLLPEMLNVSAVGFDPSTDHAALQGYEPAADIRGLWLKVTESAEQDCVRCFRRTGDVGRITAHPHLCTRCASVVEGT